MKNKLRLLPIVFILSALCLWACNTNNGTQNERKQYYEIELSTENYWRYLDWDKRNNQFVGVLSYAYYDNILVKLERTIFSEYTENTYTENYSIGLNVAGCKTYSFNDYTSDQIKELLNHTGYLGSWSYEITIIDISGSVKFSI